MQLINGDCYKEIKNIPDKSVDLVITDPPYEFQANGGGGAFGSKNKEYHKELEKSGLVNGIDASILDELVRVMKKINIYIWCNKDQLKMYMDYFLGLGCNMDLLTWHKTNPVPACNNKYLSDTEYLLFFREKGVPVYGSYHTKKKYYVTPTNVKDKKLYNHPTIKPIEIIENLVVNSSQENDVVLDVFMGSGTAGVACKKNNRHFIGIELNEEYFNTAQKRIEETNE